MANVPKQIGKLVDHAAGGGALLGDEARMVAAEVHRLARIMAVLDCYRSIAGDLWNELENAGHSDGEPCTPGCMLCYWVTEYVRIDADARVRLTELNGGREVTARRG